MFEIWRTFVTTVLLLQRLAVDVAAEPEANIFDLRNVSCRNIKLYEYFEHSFAERKRLATRDLNLIGPKARIQLLYASGRSQFVKEKI